YEMIGLGETIGAGLNLGKPEMQYGTERGKPSLVVRGIITNVKDETRPVPMIKVILRDRDNKEVQSKIAPPLRNELPAGERMNYKITVVDPSPLAHKIAVFFVEPEDAGAKKSK
ncbi:MAG: FxLYD domain-containing protein, partial [Magnetovibrio sp.]|nr:FxLYD domain-containing protein [Magnetovibrio sp.]